MTQYQDKNRLFDLKDYTVYTTLEPCAMCSGMMIMQKVRETIYGQADLAFGKALERLKYDSSKTNGYEPYPRPVSSKPSNNKFRILMDEKFYNYISKEPKEGKNITEWLRSKEAEEIYRSATNAFLNFKVQNRENEQILKSALRLLEQVPDLPEEN